MTTRQPLDANQYPIDALYLDTVNTQRLDGNSVSAATTDLAANDVVVLINAKEAFHISIAPIPTSTTAKPYMPAGSHRIAIKKGDNIAVIKASGASAGNVDVIPCSQ